MTAAVIQKIDRNRQTELANRTEEVDNVSVPLTEDIFSTESLSITSFSPKLSTVAPDFRAEERTPNIFEAMARDGERLNRICVSPYGNAFTITENKDGTGISIALLASDGSGNFAKQINIDEKVTAIEVSPDRTKLVVTLPGMATEYDVGQKGSLDAVFVYVPDQGRIVTGARYKGDNLILSFGSEDQAQIDARGKRSVALSA